MKGEQKALVQRLKARVMRRGMESRLAALTDSELAETLRGGSDGVLASAEWKALRAKMIERHGAKCMKCGYMPENVSHIHVDHIKPRRFYPELAMDEDNLQLLCGRCNKAKGNKHCTDYRHPAAAVACPNQSNRRTA